VIKTLLILVLAIALAAAAFFTRPAPATLKAQVRTDIEASSDNFLEKIAVDLRTRSFMERVQIKDRLLWLDAVREGEVVYTGAFARWFRRGQSG
jgi:hypothetical protein